MGVKRIDVKKAAGQLRAQMEDIDRQQERLQGLPEGFRRRYEAWCLSECRAEYVRDFGLVKLVRNDLASLFLEYIRTLPTDEARLRFVTTLCKRDCSDGTLDSDERQIIESYIQFSRVPDIHTSGEIISSFRISPEQQALRARFYEHGGEKHVATRILKSSLKRDGKNRLGNLILERTSALWFEKQIGIGYVVTAFEFSGWTQLKYVHTIYASPGGRVGNNISSGISILGWMGIGESTWSWLLPEDIPETVRGIMELCEHFFSATQKLLAGLEGS